MFELTRKEKQVVVLVLLAFLVGWFFREWSSADRARALSIQPSTVLEATFNGVNELP